jgi:hypothetical protein
MQRYMHGPLSTDNSIRVLELQPGRLGEPLEGRLLEVCLSNEPVFDALSYCWGEPIFDSRLICDSQTMYITEGLATALDNLRHVAEPTIIWIDQVCIAQSNVAERSSQVQLMDQIFSKARHVYIWVGPSTESSTFMLECEAKGTVEYAEIPRLLSAVVEFFERPWFDRTWTLQEVVLATEEPQVRCGHHQLAWMRLHHLLSRIASRCFSSPENPSDDGVFEVVQQKSIRDSKSWTSYLKDVDEVRVIEAHDRCLSGLLKALDGIQAINIMRGESAQALSVQLIRMLGRKVTDPRDKVFGLLGLCEFRTDPILADYSKTTTRVYSEVMARIISDDFVRSYTVHALPHCSKGTSETLPTWVPDFAAQPSAQGGWFNPVSLKNKWREVIQFVVWTALIDGPLARFSDDFATLLTGGLMLGTIVESLSLAQYRHRPARLTGWNRWLSKIVAIILIRRLRPDDILMSIYRSDPDKPEQGDLVLAAFKRLIDRVESGEKLDSDKEDWGFFVSSIRDASRSVASDSVDLTFFVTETQRTGLCVGPIAEGDILAGIFYVNMPFILRAKGNKFNMVTLTHVGGHTFEYTPAENTAGIADQAASSFQEFIIV